MKKSKRETKKIILILTVVLVVSIILFLITYFVINMNYLNSVVFHFNGSSVVEIEQGDNWNDPFVIAIYDGESIVNDVVVDGDVDTNFPGSYEITYTIRKGLSEKTLKRTVVVKGYNEGFLLTLKGNDITYIPTGSVYDELGYNAYYNGLDVSSDVIVNGEVNSEIPGEYILNYMVTKDSFSREVTRKVIVVDFNYKIALKDSSDYVKENTIVFTTSDNNYDYVLMPDGKVNYDKNISYNIKGNGEYSFVIYNKLGFNEKEIFNINNIDTISPKGTCSGYMYDTYTELIVNATDNFGVSGYDYKYGNKSSGKIVNGKYKYYENINEASVSIYDKVNNVVTIKCNMIDKSSSTPSSYQSYTFKDPDTSKTMKYWLYIPENVTRRNSVPLMIYLHGDGGRGDNINLVNNYSYPNFIKNGQEFPFMMVAGQIGNDTNWTDSGTYKKLMRLVDYIIVNYNVNTKKIILAGGSSGGGGVYVITANYPKYFSCAVVGSGIYDSGYRNIANQLIYTPMWIFHGTNDRNISYSSVESLSKYINSLGGQVKFVGIQGGTHDVTETAKGFNNPELIEWMLKQERN